ncbi:MAG TPA: aminotransferase class I/II-fold pyridoxal phosphate-dependent enzyme, partial [Nitrospiria bacterium]|nr:aminotransferase class I/II-fold pyridoxal phosphate-dependent enzyme [Nitrospiria bacterium]
NKVRQPFNTGLLAQKAAIAALSDKTHVKNTLANNKKGKAWLYKCFEEAGISYVPTETNFIYFEHPEARRLFDWMLKEGIILRYLSGNRLRITIGKQADNLKFKNRLKKYIQTQKKNPKGN